MNRRTTAVAAGVVGVLLLFCLLAHDGRHRCRACPAHIAGAQDVNQRAWDGARAYDGDFSLVAAALAMLPSIIAFLAFQRSFMRGISAGAIKG
jgi:hypothetical protein